MKMSYILAELYYDWFNNEKYWFDKNLNTDIYLTRKYYKYINKIYIENNLKQELIGAIILLDQIPRHYIRLHDNNNLKVNDYSKKATLYSELVIKLYEKTLNIDELCFIYLPYRHIYDTDKIQFIIDKFINIYKCELSDEYTKKRAKKYILNTLNNYYKFGNKLFINKSYQSTITNLINFDLNILENKSINIYNNTNNDLIYNNIYNEIFNSYIELKNNSIIIVSISGGVDSNVALYIINKINNNNKNKNIKIIPIHINYNNKDISNDELNFVNYYCSINNNKLIYRTIFEINRNQCSNSNTIRNIYEDITKKIRFDMYEYGLKYSENVYILLGHNKDDCFENIITNISSRKHYDNLSGMNKCTNINNLILWRPMIDIYKKNILDFAYKYNIPFLKDSTPQWSMRGKIRDNVKKELINLKYNDDIIETFFELKDYLSQSNEIIHNIVLNNLINKLNYSYNNIYTNISVIYNNNEINCFNYFNICFLFFKKINIKISNKTIKEFILFIKKNKNTKIYINKNVYINKIFSVFNEYFLDIYINY
jgi:tRNA(Ile)-lysidine synthetase-like protein